MQISTSPLGYYAQQLANRPKPKRQTWGRLNAKGYFLYPGFDPIPAHSGTTQLVDDALAHGDRERAQSIARLYQVSARAILVRGDRASFDEKTKALQMLHAALLVNRKFKAEK